MNKDIKFAYRVSKKVGSLILYEMIITPLNGGLQGNHFSQPSLRRFLFYTIFGGSYCHLSRIFLDPTGSLAFTLFNK